MFSLPAGAAYSVMEHLNLVRTKKCLDTLNNGFKICTDSVRSVEIGIGSRSVHLHDGEPVLRDGEPVFAAPYPRDPDTLALFDVVVGCGDSIVGNVFELVGFLVLVETVSGEEEHGRLDLGHYAAVSDQKVKDVDPNVT